MAAKSETPTLRKRIHRNAASVNAESGSGMKIVITEGLIAEIGKFADSAGVRAYIVGGYVRDVYLGRPRTDFDFTIIGDPVEFAERLAERFNTKAVVYPRFRTALVPIGHFKCEFVGTRKEEYLPDSRKPIVSEGTLEDDLRRRDFTTNAMAAGVNSDNFGQVIDLFGGAEALKNRLLDTPLDPYTTFSEDPLRMMRAARFASQLSFAIAPRVTESIKELRERIKIISQERITDEFMKIIASPVPSIGISALYEMGLLEHILPELSAMAGVERVVERGREHAHKDVLFHSLRVLDKVAEQSENVWLRLAALLHDVAKPRTKRFIEGTGWSFHGHEEIGARMMPKFFRRFKLPLEHEEYVERLIRLHQRPMVLVSEGVTDSAVRRLAFQAGDALEDLFMLCSADITTNNPKLTAKYLSNYDKVAEKVLDVQERDKLREFQSPVRGEEIMEICSIEPSRSVGYIKTHIEEAILDGLIPNEYEPAREYFLAHKDAWLAEAEELFSRGRAKGR